LDPLKLILRVISAVITIFIIQDLLIAGKILRIIPSEIEGENEFCSLSFTEYLPYFCIRVTVLLKYFDLFHNVAGAQGKCPSCLPPIPLSVALIIKLRLRKSVNAAVNYNQLYTQTVNNIMQVSI